MHDDAALIADTLISYIDITARVVADIKLFWIEVDAESVAGTITVISFIAVSISAVLT